MNQAPTSAALVRVAFIGLVSLGMLVPMYILVVNAFKSQQDILANPFTLDFGLGHRPAPRGRLEQPGLQHPEGLRHDHRAGALRQRPGDGGLPPRRRNVAGPHAEDGLTDPAVL